VNFLGVESPPLASELMLTMVEVMTCFTKRIGSDIFLVGILFLTRGGTYDLVVDGISR